MAIDEKMEMLISHYRGCYDISIARLKSGAITDDEFDEILENDYFQTSIGLIDADIQETIMLNLLDLSNSPIPNIKLKATLELGKIVYAKKFNNKTNKDDDVKHKHPIPVLRGKYPAVKND